MQRFILSACSVVLATAAIATEAQALPKIDSAFDLQTLRLGELDTRNKSDEYSQPYYSQSSPEPSPQSVSTEQERAQTTDPTTWENAESQEQPSSPVISVTERRHQSLDRS
ncbi:MAG: hypothetical protein ACFB0D_09880 [Phormidesmis sp.]